MDVRHAKGSSRIPVSVCHDYLIDYSLHDVFSKGRVSRIWVVQFRQAGATRIGHWEKEGYYVLIDERGQLSQVPEECSIISVLFNWWELVPGAILVVVAAVRAASAVFSL